MKTMAVVVSLRFLRSAANFAADLAGADDDALGVLDFGLRKSGLEAAALEIVESANSRPDDATCSWA